jgi:hypothetical protein
VTFFYNRSLIVRRKEMTFEEFQKASAKRLSAEAKLCFDNSQEPEGGSWNQRAAKLLESQFYMQELDRRHGSSVSIRDLLLEIVVIVLIGAELWMAYQQDDVLKTLQSNAAATANTLKALQGTMEAMNAGMQRKLGAFSAVSVDITYSSATKQLQIVNSGAQDIALWRYQFDGRLPQRYKPGLDIYRGASYELEEDLYVKRNRVKPGDIMTEPLILDIKSEDGREYEARAVIQYQWLGTEFGSSGKSVGSLRVSRLGTSEEAVKLAAGGVEGTLLVFPAVVDQGAAVLLDHVADKLFRGALS